MCQDVRNLEANPYTNRDPGWPRASKMIEERYNQLRHAAEDSNVRLATPATTSTEMCCFDEESRHHAMIQTLVQREAVSSPAVRRQRVNGVDTSWQMSLS